jgi:hypothetical protein
MKEMTTTPNTTVEDGLWESVEEEKRKKQISTKAYCLCAVSLILSIFAAPVVGTHSGIRPSAIVQAYSFGAASCLLAYCSLRIKVTLLGIVALLWSGYMFYPMLERALRMWGTQ